MKEPISEAHHIDNMVYMKSIPDGFFELAIVDPPYSRNSGNAFASRLKRYGSLSFNDSRPEFEYFKELQRVSVNQVIWGGNYFLDFLYATKCMIFWHKHQPVVTYAKGEIAWTSFQDRHTDILDLPYFGSHGSDSERCHPNQKPVALYKWLLENYAKAGDKIFDSHLGSQSSRIAAYDLGFDFYGAELDKEYYDQGCARFEAYRTKVTEIRELGFAKTALGAKNPTLF